MLDASRYPPLDRLLQGSLIRQQAPQFVFDLGDHAPGMGYAADVHDLERVERIAMPARIDLRVDDAEAGRAEVAADAREQVALVGDVDHDLQSFACRREARLDHRLAGADPV